MSRRDLGISVGRISSWKSHIPMSKEAEGDTHVIVDTNRQVQAWGGVEGVGRGGGWQKQRALQREVDSTKCHRKVKDNEEGMSNIVFL